jgi:hypothetical protein
MEFVAPRIYVRLHQQAAMSIGERLVAACIGSACAAVLVLAAILPPNPSGVGTHQWLGLQPCQFMQRTGLPCPSCGMTTSFALFMHGHWLNSFFVQPFGFALAVSALVTTWAALYSAATAMPVHQLLRLLPLRRLLFPVLFFGIVAWMWKIAIHLRGWDGF